jgi:hypothetical protein
LNTLDYVISTKTKQPELLGEESSVGGRPREINDEEQRTLVTVVFKERGSCKVTIPYCKKRLPLLRRVHDTTVSRALQLAGLCWLQRRMKWTIPADHKEARVAYAETVLLKHQATIGRHAFTDGTSFYLARSWTQVEHKQRAALGRYVYRMASGSDGMFDENIGPSLYAKAQGLPVKIWGFLANCF